VGVRLESRSRLDLDSRFASYGKWGEFAALLPGLLDQELSPSIDPDARGLRLQTHVIGWRSTLCVCVHHTFLTWRRLCDSGPLAELDAELLSTENPLENFGYSGILVR